MNITQTDSGDKYHNGESSTIKIRSPMKESQNMFNLPSPITHPDQYKQNLSNLVRRFSLPIVAIGAVFVFWILSQLLTTILLGAATLVAAVASIAIGWLSVMMAKPFSLWIANKRMSLMLAEARKRPIETREYVSRYNRQRLVEQSNELDNYVAEVNAFENEVKKMRISNSQRVGPFAERLVELRELSVREACARIILNDFLYFPIGVIMPGTPRGSDFNYEPYVVVDDCLHSDDQWLYTVVTGHADLDEEDIVAAHVERVKFDCPPNFTLLRQTESIRLNDCDICIRSVDSYFELPY